MKLATVARTIKEHLWGPVGSVCFHIVLVAVLLHFATTSAPPDAPGVAATTVDPVETQLDKVDAFLDRVTRTEPPDPTEPVTPPIVDINQPMESFSEGAAGLGGVTEGRLGSDTGEARFADFSVARDEVAAATMKDLYSTRTKPGRDAGIKKHHGDLRTEIAVVKALEWLKKNQAADGSWGAQNPIAITGLGLLTFLAHGELLDSTNYGATVANAIKFIMSKQGEDGGFGNAHTQPGVYTHGIATYAISEAYGLTRIPSLKPAMDKAVELIIKGQQAGGGWDYAYAKGPRVDTSVAGWQIQALKAAHGAGSETPGIKEALGKAANYLKGMQNPETGAFGYSAPGQGSPAITGVGVLCLQMTGHAKDKEVEKGLQYMRDWDLRWDKPLSPAAALYGWYYVTQAKFQKQGGDWEAWNQHLKKELPANQKEDGHWDFPGEEHGKACGPAYSTTLAALTLQVYYRFLPTYAPAAAAPSSADATDEVKIEVI